MLGVIDCGVGNDFTLHAIGFDKTRGVAHPLGGKSDSIGTVGIAASTISARRHHTDYQQNKKYNRYKLEIYTFHSK
jgi:hypothetical protein